MMIVRSKKYTENRQEMEGILHSKILRFASKMGIPPYFVMDSKIIQDSIASISSRVADLSESVVIDKHQIKMEKESEEFKKDIEQDEIKTAMESMAKVDRKLRKPEKTHTHKSGVSATKRSDKRDQEER